MKAALCYFGTDTYGRQVEIAMTDMGDWYGRYMTRNSYGQQMSKWEAHELTCDTHGTNKYSGEKFKFENPIPLWGFNRLASCSPKGLRLPNK